MKKSMKALAVAAAVPMLGIAIVTPASAATLKSTYSGIGHIVVCHVQELRATSGNLSSVYNSTQSGSTLKATTNVATSPALQLLGEDGLTYRIEGKSNAVCAWASNSSMTGWSRSK